MTIPSPDAFKDKGTWARWRKKNSPGRSPEDTSRSMDAPVNPFTNDPTNPFTILKREREIREAATDGEL